MVSIFKAYLVGSSKNMTGGLLTSSRAMESLLRWPPESLEALVWRASFSERRSRTSSTCRHPGQEELHLFTLFYKGPL